MKSSKYVNTIEIEFRDLIKHLLESERKSFHLYTIHRVLSLGLLIDMTFQYIELPKEEDGIGIELNLKGFGKVLFIMDLDSNYVRFSGTRCRELLEEFVEKFDVDIKKANVNQPPHKKP